MFKHHATAETYLIAARFPASIESFCVVVSHRTSGHPEPVGASGPEAELAVVLERAAADRDVLAFERGAAGIGVLEKAIFDGQVIAGE
jgi:hypothetical protein